MLNFKAGKNLHDLIWCHSKYSKLPSSWSSFAVGHVKVNHSSISVIIANARMSANDEYRRRKCSDCTAGIAHHMCQSAKNGHRSAGETPPKVSGSKSHFLETADNPGKLNLVDAGKLQHRPWWTEMVIMKCQARVISRHLSYDDLVARRNLENTNLENTCNTNFNVPSFSHCEEQKTGWII